MAGRESKCPPVEVYGECAVTCEQDKVALSYERNTLHFDVCMKLNCRFSFSGTLGLVHSRTWCGGRGKFHEEGNYTCLLYCVTLCANLVGDQVY